MYRPLAQDWLLALIALGLGLYTYLQGRKMATNPTSAPLSPIAWIAIGLVYMVQGEEAAAAKKAELVQPSRLQRSGQYAKAVGGGLILVGCLQFTAWILKLIGM